MPRASLLSALSFSRDNWNKANACLTCVYDGELRRLEYRVLHLPVFIARKGKAGTMLDEAKMETVCWGLKLTGSREERSAARDRSPIKYKNQDQGRGREGGTEGAAAFARK